jgi:hypothetical protein
LPRFARRSASGCCCPLLLKKWEAERRAQLPLDVMHPIEIAGGLVAAGLMLCWSLPYLF